MFSLSSYFSVEYMLILLPLSVGLYLILPQKLRRISLLLCSYAFFWAVSGKLIVYLLISTLLVYLFGLWLGRIQDELAQALAVCEKGGKKAVRAQYQARLLRVCVLGVLLHVGILLGVKYTPFFSDNLNVLLRMLHIPVVLKRPVFAIPIGISFYTMQVVLCPRCLQGEDPRGPQSSAYRTVHEFLPADHGGTDLPVFRHCRAAVGSAAHPV